MFRRRRRPPPATAAGCPERAHQPAERGAAYAHASQSQYDLGGDSFI